MTDQLSDPDVRTRFREALLHWYQDHRRALPWRENHDPYRIWISEMILQQTRIDQGLPYFERFLAAFPNVEALAAAPLDNVLKAWEGLGYYARARNLHRAARMIVEEHDSRIPDTMEAISTLPGIGPYTAAAVLSIAYNRDHPVVDGNVIRVLCRLFEIREDPRNTATKRELLRVAEHLLPEGEASDFNQAMMELGSLVCTPRNPQCPECPVGECCRARHLEDPSILPIKPPKQRKPHYDVTAGIIRGQDGRILLAQRPASGLLGGLWEFPGGKQEPGESLEECLKRELREELRIEVRVDERLPSVKHAYSHFAITLHGFACTHLSGEPQAIDCADWRWIRPEELSDFALPRADRKLLDAMREVEYSLSCSASKHKMSTMCSHKYRCNKNIY